jgi:hypothetical protein
MVNSNYILDTTVDPLQYESNFKKIYEYNILTNRKKYCNWIDNVSKKNCKSIFWWFLNHVSRNLYYESLFHNFCLLESINYFFQNNKKIKLIIVKDDILDYVKNILKNSSVQIDVLKKESKLPLYKITKFIFVIFFNLIFVKIFFVKKKNYYTLVDIYVFGKDINKNNSYKSLPKKKNLFYVPTFVELSFLQVLKIFFKIKSDKRFLLREELLKFIDIFKLIKIFFYAYFLNIKAPKLGKWNFSVLLRKEATNFSRFESIIYSYLNYLFAYRLKQSGNIIKRTVNWFENQNLDKGWNLGFLTYFPQARIIGYQGFTYSPHFLNHHPTNFEIESNVIPKVIYCRSIFFNNKINEFSDKVNLKAISLFNKNDNFIFKKIRKNKHYSFIFSGIYSYDIFLFNQMLKFALTSDKLIYVKFHPALSSEFLIKESRINYLPKNIVIYNNLKKLLITTQIVIASGPTTSLIEALLYDCKLILLNPSIYDKLVLVKYKIPKKSYLFYDNLDNFNYKSEIKLKKLLEKNKKKLKRILPYETSQLQIDSII